MNLILRMIRVVLAALLGRRLGIHDTSVLRFRCWPHDLDVNLHMNNGRYHTLMDLGRLDLILRSGVWRAGRGQRWMPVLGSSFSRFRRSILPFQPFELHTRVLHWDDKWFYMEQRFVRDGRTVMIAWTKGTVRRSGGVVTPAEVLERAFGAVPPSPAGAEGLDSYRELEGFVTAED